MKKIMKDIDFRAEIAHNEDMKEEDDASIPASLLTKLYDSTGTTDGSCKGYFLFYINDKGDPFAITKFENMAVKFALSKAVETMVEESFDYEDED